MRGEGCPSQHQHLQDVQHARGSHASANPHIGSNNFRVGNRQYLLNGRTRTARYVRVDAWGYFDVVQGVVRTAVIVNSSSTALAMRSMSMSVGLPRSS